MLRTITPARTRIFADLAARVPNDDGARYAALAELAALYAAWDVLDFAAVLAHADRLLALPLAAIANMAGHAARRDMALWFDASTCTYADDGSAVVRRASLICGTPRRCCCAIASTAAYSIRPSW